MAPRKKKYDPRQLTFNFDVMADHIESIQRENTQNDEVVSYVRPTDSTLGNSEKAFAPRNNPQSTHRGVQQLGLFDTRQVGAEPARRVGGAGSDERIIASNDTERTTADRDTRLMQRVSSPSGITRDERLGISPERGDRYVIENYTITPQDLLGVGGVKAKYADNIAAIHTLRQLQVNKAVAAGPEEKKSLLRYVGWGGMPQAFDPLNSKWAAEYQELQALLSPDDYGKARRSTQDAHFTPETVVRGIYQGLSHLGVSGELHILEPAAGIGNFIGLRPEGFANAKFSAIELDPTTSAISKYLYPKAIHRNTGFQNICITDPIFDLAIGNPPFGQQTVYDPDFPELRKSSIHNYFLAKSLRLVREGGIGAFVVSRYFMDAADPTVREYIAEYADFLGAIRIPDNAFQENALTQVTTDIVFFQKKSGQRSHSQDWVHITSVEVDDLKNGGKKSALINKYFAERSDMVIGSMAYTDGRFQDVLNCVAPSNLDLSKEIAARVKSLPPLVYIPMADRSFEHSTDVQPQRDENFIASEYFTALKLNSLCVEPKTGKIIFKCVGAHGEDSYDVPVVKDEKARQRIVGMIKVRDSLRTLLHAEKSNTDESELKTARRSLNREYDAFQKRFGFLNSQINRSLMKFDPQHSLLGALESKYDKGVSKEQASKLGKLERPASAQKATIFQKRVLQPALTVDSAATAKDALIIALRETGRIDFPRMALLLGKPAAAIQKDLQEQSLVFRNPATENWEISDKYLTGNVREKLRIASEAAQSDPQYQINVEALARAMPPEIEAADIGITFGATWIPSEVLSTFIEDCIHHGRGQQVINYIPVLGRWEGKVSVYDHAANTEIWGIPEYPASKLIESLLNNRAIKVEKESGQYDSNDKPIMVVDQELTAVAMQKADKIRQAFLDWVWTDDERRTMLATLYNERFNTHVPPHYDGSHLVLTDSTSDVSLRPHQKDAVWRGIQEGTALFDHVVGAGKTMACVATIMESKRMGFLAKPMVVVPNHLLLQWRDEFFRLYPNANILVAEKTDFVKENRERFFSRIATGDWDAVIVAHSSFKKIDMPQDLQGEILQEQIDAVIMAIRESRENDGSRATVKQLEKQRDRMQVQYSALMAKGGKKDSSVDFADLGVDGLFVDESHEFKNLSYSTTMNVSGLGNISGSSKALDLFIKCRYLQKQNDGRGVYFMTGTPISNTIAEVYTLQRYLQYDDLKQKNIESFDGWASTFGKVTCGLELDATGVNYKLKSRFASFQNVPELLAMYRTVADVVTKKDLDQQAIEAGNRPYTPPVLGGKPHNDVAERSESQAAYMQNIIHRMEHLPNDPRIDNPLKITNDARKAGLDFRLIDPTAEDNPTSKVNLAVKRIHEIWQNTAEDKGTQLVFCDLSTPKGGTSIPVSDSEVVEFEPALDPHAKFESADIDSADLIEAGNEDGDDISVSLDMDACIAASSRFSVYDDMKQKLIEQGIPADEIAFIHDANTDLRKAKLFSDMDTGRIRVLFGSTAKMGAGMNVQTRLVAAHHLDAPWRPSDLEQRNGRIIRQGNALYARDPDNFSVGVYYYATKQTYDARMWQTIEYKAAAIEQFRKGDLLQRVIDDVQSEAATAAEMKAAASGNPLILEQVRLASDLRKLEALYSQHQRSQHRLKDHFKWLGDSSIRLGSAEAEYAANTQLRDNNTRTVVEKGKPRMLLEFFVNGQLMTEKQSDAIKEAVRKGVHAVLRDFREQPLVGVYRGFEVRTRHTANGFRFTLKGTGQQEFQPENLRYTDNEKLSLTGLFQRIDNFLDKGLEANMQNFRATARKELEELETVKTIMGQGFPQQAELALTRENHADVLAELRRIQDDPQYVSEWKPKNVLPEPPVAAFGFSEAQAPEQGKKRTRMS